MLTAHDFGSRGERFDRQLRDLQRAWDGEALTPDSRPVAPAPVGGRVPVLIGGTSDAAVRRVVEFGVGWTAGGMPPDGVADMVQRVRAAWDDAGRQGRPRIVALGYFGLGDTTEESRRNLFDYYEPMGNETATMIADNAMRSPDAVRGALDAYADAGVDEFVFDASVSTPTRSISSPTSSSRGVAAAAGGWWRYLRGEEDR